MRLPPARSTTTFGPSVLPRWRSNGPVRFTARLFSVISLARAERLASRVEIAKRSIMRRNHFWLGTTLGLALAACRADAVPTPDTGTAVAPTATAPTEAPPAAEPKAEPVEPTLAKTTTPTDADAEGDPAKAEPAVVAPEAK